MNKKANLGLQKAVVVIILLAVLVTMLLVSYGPSGLLTNLNKFAGDVGHYLGDLLMPSSLDDDQVSDRRKIEDKDLDDFVTKLREELQRLAESSRRPEQSCIMRLDFDAPDLDDSSVILSRRGNDGIRFDVVEVDGKDTKRLSFSTINKITLCSVHNSDAIGDWYNLYFKNPNVEPPADSSVSIEKPQSITIADEKLLIDGLAAGEAKLPYDDRLYLYYDSTASTDAIAAYCFIPSYGEVWFDSDCDLADDVNPDSNREEEYRHLIDDDCLDDWEDAGGYISLPDCNNIGEAKAQKTAKGNGAIPTNPEPRSTFGMQLQ